jgi:hypothetical protein
LIGKNGLFLGFETCAKAIYAVSRLQNAGFGVFLPIILAYRPVITGASSS